jgi:hypothetical protein
MKGDPRVTTIKMLAKITGTRNGLDWPDIGETIELPDAEAEQLIGQKLAKPARKDASTLQGADHVDHSGDTAIENAQIRANLRDALAAAKDAGVEVADVVDDETESTVLTTGKAGRK